MKRMLLAVVMTAALVACKQDVPVEEPPVVEKPGGNVHVGETYEKVLDKLGQPNIDSEGDSSRVLIYDEIEIKLQSNVVVEVYDHRP